jgi:hypothetical protein
MSKALVSILVVILLIFGSYFYISMQISDVEPVGRLGLVKMGNPDMYPGHAQSKVLAEYATKKGSKCALVVHYGGDSNYACYKEGNIEIIELAFVDPENYRTDINWGEVIQTFIFGVPDNKYHYRSDGKEFDNLSSAMTYVNKVAKRHGQEGPIPMFWHGTVRTGSPYINPGCGFPLFVQITWKEYGRFGAYYYIAKGLIFPYVSNPYAVYELTHASDLQKLYNQNKLNYY